MKYRININYSFDCPEETPLNHIISKLEEIKNMGESMIEKNEDFENITKSSSISISEDVRFGEYSGTSNIYYHSQTNPLNTLPI